MKKIIAITACLLLLPMAALAAHKASAKKPSKAAIAACVGRVAGDAVELPGKKGKLIPATCKDVKGQLVAVPAKKK